MHVGVDAGLADALGGQQGPIEDVVVRAYWSLNGCVENAAPTPSGLEFLLILYVFIMLIMPISKLNYAIFLWRQLKKLRSI